MEDQLWIVTDEDNHWLWHGRGTQQDAVAGAQEASDFDPDSTLYLYAVATQIVLNPPISLANQANGQEVVANMVTGE